MCPRQHHNVQMLAYFIWLNRGCPNGEADANWHEAEKKFFDYVENTAVTGDTSLFGLAAIEEDKEESS